MTDKKSLKQRVRARQEKTGERYTTALSHIRARADDGLEAELHDVSRAARLEGFTCQAFASEGLWHAECALGAPELRFRGVFERLRALLLASLSSAPAAALARVLVRGDKLTLGLATAIEEIFGARDFLAQARAGVRGVSRNGRLVAFDTPRGDGWAPVVGAVIAPPHPSERVPLLWLSALGDSRDGLGRLLEQHFSLAGLGGWSRERP